MSRVRFPLMLTLVAIAAIALVSLSSSQQASAHTAGKAIPKIDPVFAPDPNSPLTQDVTVTITDADSGTPVEGAVVTADAKMEIPHEMEIETVSLPPSTKPGVYYAPVRLPMAAEWIVTIKVTGSTVQNASQDFTVRSSFGSIVTPSAGTGSSTVSPPTVPRAPAKIKGRLTLNDLLPVTSLVLHSATAILWVFLTLLLMLAADPAGRSWLTTERRDEILGEKSLFRRAALAAGGVVIATGVFNGLVAAPFSLEPTPSAIGAAMKAPFGSLYLLILTVKIGIFVALVLVNRLRGNDEEDRADAARLALKADAVLLPLLLIAVVLLRYVHILSHVAQAAS